MYILPNPQKWTLGNENYYLTYYDMIAVDRDCDDTIGSYALQLQKYIQEEVGLELGVTKGDASKGAIRLCMDNSCSKQEYYLTVDEKGICISASEKEGMLHGIQSLKQILRQAGAQIPYMNIHDYPDVLHRGLYYDVTRGRIPTLQYLKKLADFMAEYKMNQLHLYIEHTFMFEGLSEMWRDDTPLTAQDILEFDEYCSRLNIELVPSIATFGHLYKLLRTKDFRHLCEMSELCDEEFSFSGVMKHHTLDVSNPESLTLVKRLIKEYMALFRSDKFNICGDETFDLGKGRSKALADEIGTDVMYTNFVKELCEFVIEQGKTPMFWGDIICKFPESIHELPKQTICLNWGYYANLTDESIRKFAESGVRQYCCPGVRGWKQFVNEIGESYENIKRMCTYAVQYNSEGLLNTDWGDYGHINHPDFGFTGMIYGAAFSWNKNIPAFEEINRQISRVEFRDSQEAFVSIIAKISKNQVYKWRDMVRFMQEGESLFGTEPSENTEIVKKNLAEIKMQLAQVVSGMDTKRKQVLQAYLVAIDGILLVQDIGDAILGIKNNAAEKDKLSALAARLETWFYYYKREWRKVSRESELFRIQNVINYYADYLRDNGGKAYEKDRRD